MTEKGEFKGFPEIGDTVPPTSTATPKPLITSNNHSDLTNANRPTPPLPPDKTTLPPSNPLPLSTATRSVSDPVARQLLLGGVKLLEGIDDVINPIYNPIIARNVFAPVATGIQDDDEHML